MSTIDLAVAKANLAAELEAARTHVAELEAREKVINLAGEDVLTLIDTINKYGRVRKVAAVATNGNGHIPLLAELPEDANLTERVESFVTHSMAPQRAADLMPVFGLERAEIASALARLAQQQRLKIMGRGLYWRVNAGKGASIAAAAAKDLHEGVSYDDRMADLRNRVYAVLKAVDGPINIVTIEEEVVKTNFDFHGAAPRGVLARLMPTMVGKKVKKVGGGPHTKYQAVK